MLRHRGAHAEAARLEHTTEATLAAGVRTPDLGGSATIVDGCKSVIAAL